MSSSRSCPRSRRRSVLSPFLLLLLALPPSPADAQTAGPSFDCAAADGQVEELICADDGLAAQDVRLAEVLGQSVEVIQGFPQDVATQELARFRAEQRGWISGRNECWKADDVRACTEDEYKRRIAELQTGYRLVEPTATVFWTCDGNPANEFVTTFFPTDPGSAVVERGDRNEVVIQTPTASGARYAGPLGAYVWVKGDEATAEWPQGEEHRCVVRERRKGDR